jgi:hypothetical protein
VELLPPWLPLPLTAALPLAKATPRNKPAAPPRTVQPRVMYGRMVVRSRSPPRGPLVPGMRPMRTPSRSPPAARRHP